MPQKSYEGGGGGGGGGGVDNLGELVYMLLQEAKRHKMHQS